MMSMQPSIYVLFLSIEESNRSVERFNDVTYLEDGVIRVEWASTVILPYVNRVASDGRIMLFGSTENLCRVIKPQGWA